MYYQVQVSGCFCISCWFRIWLDINIPKIVFFLAWDVWLISEHLNLWDHIGWTDSLWINRNREGISLIKRSSSSALHVNPIQSTLLKIRKKTWIWKKMYLWNTRHTSDKILHVYTRNFLLLWTQLHAYEICCFSWHREIKKTDYMRPVIYHEIEIPTIRWFLKNLLENKKSFESQIITWKPPTCMPIANASSRWSMVLNVNTTNGHTRKANFSRSLIF